MTKKRTPPPAPVFTGYESNAEINRRVLARVAKMTPQEIFELSVRAGIHRPDGELMPEYGGPPLPKPTRKRRNAATRKTAG